jgi:GNAT superfamily N-acetyltransferase
MVGEVLTVSRADGYRISTDPALLDVDAIAHWIGDLSYWAKGRSRAVIEKSLAHSLCFGIYQEIEQGQRQVGIARVVTDYVTFGWLCDVYIDAAHRGQGLGKWLVATIITHPDLATIRRIMLATRDAHGLYRQFGFVPETNVDIWMNRTQPALSEPAD